MLMGLVRGSADDANEPSTAIGTKPQELTDLPNCAYPEALPISYSKYTETGIEYQGEEAKIQVFLGSSGPSSILAFEDNNVHCIDEFIGFADLVEEKIEPAIKNSNYNFCTNNGVAISADNYEIEHELNCDKSGWTRLDCKFIPGGKPESAFIASRMGKRKGVVGRVFRKITDPAVELFVDRVPGFTDRVSCEKKMEKLQIDECHSLLLAWTVLDNALGDSASKKAKSVSLDIGEATEDKKDKKTGEGSDDEEVVEKDVNTALYVGVGVLGILVILIGASVLMGDKKKEREQLEQLRPERKRGGKKAGSVDDLSDNGEAPTEKRHHRRHHRKHDEVESPSKDIDQAPETPVAPT